MLDTTHRKSVSSSNKSTFSEKPEVVSIIIKSLNSERTSRIFLVFLVLIASSWVGSIGAGRTLTPDS